MKIHTPSALVSRCETRALLASFLRPSSQGAMKAKLTTGCLQNDTTRCLLLLCRFCLLYNHFSLLGGHPVVPYRDVTHYHTLGKKGSDILGRLVSIGIKI